MKKILIATTALAAIGAAATTYAQTSGSLNDDTQVLISQIQTDKRAIMLASLGLTDPEMAAFTPLYDEYQAKAKERMLRTSDLLNKFVANYDSMDEKTAKQIIKEFFKLRDERIALLKEYSKKLERKLPAQKVLRFVQIENKMNALLDVEAAAAVPLAK
jgi:uncharacterized protein involved in exopolysaccharide biosynthesis